MIDFLECTSHTTQWYPAAVLEYFHSIEQCAAALSMISNFSPPRFQPHTDSMSALHAYRAATRGAVMTGLELF